MTWYMNSSMTCPHLTHRQMVGPVMMIPALCQIKPFLISFPYPGHGDGLAIPHLHRDKFLSIPCEKSGNLLHITHPHIILL